MTERKKTADVTESEFDETLARLLQTNPEELAASMAALVTRQQASARKRIADARKEIEDGARPRKGRFRL